MPPTPLPTGPRRTGDDDGLGEAMRRGAPSSMVSTVRDDPRRSGYLRDALYTLRITKKILVLITIYLMRWMIKHTHHKH